MYKSFSLSMLVGASLGAMAFPPDKTPCAQVIAKKISTGTTEDVQMGGCKCAASGAEWSTAKETHGPAGVKAELLLACHCVDPKTYMAFPAKEVKDTPLTKNRKACGVIV